MTHITALARGSRDPKKIVNFLLTRGGGPEGPGPSSPCAGRGGKDNSNVAPLHAECYAIHASSIASNLDPKLMPKEQDQITIRKVCTLIQSLVSLLPNPHSSHGYDHEKHHTLLTLKRRVNIAHNVTNVEQHELSRADASCPLLDVAPERANPLAVVEGVQSRFL